MKKTGLLILILLYAFAGIAQEIAGSWYGTLELPTGKVRLVFHITEKDGVLQSKMDSPDQGANGIPCESVTFKDAHLTITSPVINAKYEGKYADAEIKGTFNQGNVSLPLTLSKQEIKQERPQEPHPPYPYHTEDVTFENKQAGITLAGTLTLPQKSGVYPAVILISGSGAQNRNEEILGHKPFLVLADHLTRQGVAVLRFDDRGFGLSTGNYETSTAADFATDVEAAVSYLKKRKEIKTQQIGLIGHSEGGMIAPMVATRSKDIAFMVLLAAPGVHHYDLWIRQLSDMVAIQGISKEKQEPLIQCYRDIYRILKTTPGQAAQPELEKYLKAHLTDFTAGQPLPPGKEKPFIDQMVKTFILPWFRYFITYNPIPNLEKTKCPVLALNGEKDIQVNATQNLLGINQALTKAGNKSFKTIPLPGLNHLFQECKTGATEEYGILPQTFSPKALRMISEWIQEQTKK